MIKKQKTTSETMYRRGIVCNASTIAKRFSLAIILTMSTLIWHTPMFAEIKYNIPYIDENGALQTATEATKITSTTTDLNGNITNGWYYVDNDGAVATSNLTVTGDVKIILTDDCDLTSTGNGRNAGIKVEPSNSLTIFGQQNGTGTVNATGGDWCSGIGSNYEVNGGTIIINSGTVNAKGGSTGSAIGSGFTSTRNSTNGGTIIINGGTVTAIGGDNGSAIGGGCNSEGGNITITGGIVIANSGSYSSGIGGGMYGNGATVTINGGMVTATNEDRYGFGIGGSFSGSSGSLIMNGNAFVNALSVSDAGAKAGGILFNGNTGTMYGDVTLAVNAIIPTGKTLTIPLGQTLTIAAGVILTNNGTSTNNGTFINNGTFTNDGTLIGCIINKGIINGVNTVSVCVTPTPDPTTHILYVKEDGTGDGSSWANAYPNLADPLLEAQTNTDIQQIWVAAGTYYPLHKAALMDNDYSAPAPTTDRDKSFVLVKDVKIYGGFDAATPENDIADRNWATNVTTLSGDIGMPGDNADNAYHVVIGAGDVGDALLDGFTITGGNADGGNNIDVNGLNISRAYGGGIYNKSSSPMLTNATVSGNSAPNYRGGGIYNEGSSPTLTNVTVSGNSAGFAGGGIFNTESCYPKLINVTVSGNTAGNYGGGIYDYYHSSSDLTNTIVWGNSDNNRPNGSCNYSLIEGRDLTSDGVGNLDGKTVGDPFVDATGGDFSLKANHPAVNAGDNEAYKTARSISNFTGETDLAGNPRLSGATIDMGAYEFQIPKELTPNAAINYENETLTGLSGDYIIDGTDETITGDYSIGETRMTGNNLSIVKKGNGSTTLDSNPQTLIIPARPVAPSAGKTDETIEGRKDGTLTGITTDMEYKSSTATDWIDGTNSDIISLAPSIYEVRFKAVTGTSGSFTSFVQTLTIGTVLMLQTTPQFADHTTIEKTYDDAAFNLPTVTGGESTGNYSYRSENPSVATVDASGQVTVHSVGATVMYVKRSGDTNYIDSDEDNITVNVTKATGTLAISQGNIVYNTPFSPQIVSQTGNGAVSYQYKVQGANDATYSPTKPSVVGNYTVRGQAAATLNYTATISASVNFTIIATNQTTPQFADHTTIEKTYGDEPFDLPEVSGGQSTGDYNFRSSYSAVATVDAVTGQVTIIGAGSAMIYVKKSGDANYHDSAEDYILVNVAKANYSDITHNPLLVLYTETNTLTDVEGLQAGFSWVNPNEKLRVEKNSYAAIYNADSNNYNDFELEITVNVAYVLYNITVAETTNGEVIPWFGAAPEDLEVFMRVIPAKGYEFADFKIYKTDDERQTIKVYGDGYSRTFYMPACDVTIAATFKPTTSTGIADVETGHASSLHAISIDGGLRIKGLIANEMFSIYNLQGKLVYKEKAVADEQTVSLRERGIYIVVAGERQVKAVY